MARPATVPGIRHKKGEKRLTAPCDCESVLEAEGWTLGNPAYSLRNTSSGLVLSFLCHVLPAGLFPLSLLSPVPYLFLSLSSRTLARECFMFMVV